MATRISELADAAEMLSAAAVRIQRSAGEW